MKHKLRYKNKKLSVSLAQKQPKGKVKGEIAASARNILKRSKERRIQMMSPTQARKAAEEAAAQNTESGVAPKESTYEQHHHQRTCMLQQQGNWKSNENLGSSTKKVKAKAPGSVKVTGKAQKLGSTPQLLATSFICAGKFSNGICKSSKNRFKKANKGAEQASLKVKARARHLLGRSKNCCQRGKGKKKLWKMRAKARATRETEAASRLQARTNGSKIAKQKAAQQKKKQPK